MDMTIFPVDAPSLLRFCDALLDLGMDWHFDDDPWDCFASALEARALSAALELRPITPGGVGYLAFCREHLLHSADYSPFPDPLGALMHLAYWRDGDPHALWPVGEEADVPGLAGDAVVVHSHRQYGLLLYRGAGPRFVLAHHVREAPEPRVAARPVSLAHALETWAAMGWPPVLGEPRDRDDDDDDAGHPGPCGDPAGHSWVVSDEDGRTYCQSCFADGDA